MPPKDNNRVWAVYRREHTSRRLLGIFRTRSKAKRAIGEWLALTLQAVAEDDFEVICHRLDTLEVD